MESSRTATVVYPTDRDLSKHRISIFLAGTTVKTTGPNWRETLISDLSQYPVTIIDPYQPKWDSTWREDMSDSRFREQVEWELHMQDCANIVAILFHPESQAPISLLELGLCARGGEQKTVVVGCPEGFWKRGNVQVVCQRFGIPLLDSEDEFRRVVVEKVEEACALSC